MNRTGLLRHSVRAMVRYRMRNAFIMLGSFVGVAALTLVLCVGAGAKRKMMATVRQLFGASSILIMAGGTQLMGGSGANAARLTLDDLEAIAAAVPEIAIWDPQQAIPDASVRHDGATATARVIGESEWSSEVWNRGVTRGAYFDAGDVRASERVALIGETTAQELFGRGDPLDGEILIGNVPFRIVGMLEPFGTDLHGMDRDDEIVIPISTMMRRVLNTDTIAMAKLLVREPSQVDAATREVKRILRERHGIPAGRPDDFTLITATRVQSMVARVQRILDIYLPLVAAVALLVAAVVASALMLASVSARTGEIGLRRAVGARIEDVQFQFVVETAATMLGGGIAGIVLGSIAAQLIANRYSLGPVISWPPMLLGLVVAAIAGFLAGILPARRAAKLDPMDALR